MVSNLWSKYECPSVYGISGQCRSRMSLYEREVNEWYVSQYIILRSRNIGHCNEFCHLIYRMRFQEMKVLEVNVY